MYFKNFEEFFEVIVVKVVKKKLVGKSLGKKLQCQTSSLFEEV